MFFLRLFSVVLQELHCLQKCILVVIMDKQSFVSQLCTVIEICESKLKKQHNNKNKMKNCENEL